MARSVRDARRPGRAARGQRAVGVDQADGVRVGVAGVRPAPDLGQSGLLGPAARPDVVLEQVGDHRPVGVDGVRRVDRRRHQFGGQPGPTPAA